MAENRRAGILYAKIDGTQRNVKGSWTYNVGAVKREAIVGADGVHGYKEMPQVPRIEGEITDASDLSLAELTGIEQATITLELANGKTFVLRDAWYAADGDVGTEEGNVQIRFEGMSAEESGGGGGGGSGLGGLGDGLFT